MGILSAFRSSGGGFLNNVDAVIQDVQCTTEPDFANAKSGGDSKVTKLWVKLVVKQDGSDVPESTHLDAGGADDFVISDDGHTLTPVGADAKLWGGTDWLKFVESAETNGVEFPDYKPGDVISFEPLIGQRVRLVQVKNDEAMLKAAKDFKANKGKTRTYYNDQGQKKGKDGKFYDQRTLQVSQVYGRVDTPKVPTSAAKQPAKGGKPAAKPVVTSDIQSLAGEVLTTILSNAKDRKLSKSKVNYEVTRLYATPAFKERVSERDDVRKYLYDDANLETFASEGIISFDKASKDQTISLV